MKYETFQQKLDRFKSEPVGFLVKSKEIADELARVFEREGMKPRGRCTTMAVAMRSIWGYAKESSYVTYNYRGDRHKLSGGNTGYSGTNLDELLDVTLDELKEYLESSPQTLEDKLKLFKAGTHVLHTPTQEIYDKLMEELEKRGYKWPGWHSLTIYSFTDAGYGRKDLCIQCNDFEDKIVSCGYIKYRKQEGLGIITLTPEDFKGSEQEVHMKITIETDGNHKTTAECNGITAESLCNPMDDFKLPKGVHMAVQRLLERLEEPEEDTGFHVGDIVEVVDADGYSFSEEIKGIQGVVVHVYEDACGVKIPFEVSKSDTWAYKTDSLKLIRRGNN